MNVFCQNHVHLHRRITCLSNPTGVRYSRGGKKEGGGAQLNGEQDGTDGEMYNNGL